MSAHTDTRRVHVGLLSEMGFEEAKEKSRELYALTAALNAKTKEAQAQGLNVAMFVHDALTGPVVVVNVTVSPNKLTA